MAVPRAVVQTAHTPPHDGDTVALFPGASVVEGPTLSADQPLRKGVLAGVGGEAGGSSLGGALRCLSPCQLRLGNGSQQGDEHLAVRLQGVDVLLPEQATDAQLLQLPDGLRAFVAVPGKPGDRFGQYPVDLSLPAVSEEPLKVLPLLGGGTGDFLIGVEVHYGPVFLGGDEGAVSP